jgi:hypothetical protein
MVRPNLATYECDGAGEITRGALEMPAVRRLDMPIFGMEIGAGTNGFTDCDLYDQNGQLIGRLLCTGQGRSFPAPLNVAEKKAHWAFTGPVFPQKFEARYYGDTLPPRPDPDPCTVRLFGDFPFPSSSQGWAPPSTLTQCWQVRVNGWNGTHVGYLYHSAGDDPGAQHWASAPGTTDSHGFWLLGPTDSLFFSKMDSVPTPDSTWRHVQTK